MGGGGRLRGFQNLFKNLIKPAQKRKIVGKFPEKRRLALENLEERALLAVIAGTESSLPVPNPTGADSVLVTTLADTVDASDNVVSLREAIAAVDAGGTITFDAALAGGTITLSGTELLINKSLTIDASALAGGITINANRQSRVFNIDDGTDASLVVALTNLTVTGGRITDEHGGGIYNAEELTLTNCTVAGNRANFGGGIYNQGTLTLTGCTISGNFASSRGGGIYISSGTLTLTNCTISGNSANGNGGGISNYGTLTLTNCTVAGNLSGFLGGGIYNEGTLTLTDCVISDNSAEYGGGIYNNGGTLTLTNCTVFGNSAEYIDRSVGGGISNSGTSGTATLTGCTVVGNSAFGGGGIYNDVTLTMTNCTISGNSAYSGGGIYHVGTLTLYNSIVMLNTASDSENDIFNYYSGDSINAYNSLSSYTDWDTSESCYVYDAESPLFADAENGDYTLCENSQAIGRGNNAYAVYPDGSAILTDLAGKARIAGGAVDLGAYEFQGAEPQTLGVTLTGYSGVYDGASHGVTLSGTQTGDIVTYSANGIAYSDTPITYKKVGNYTLYVKVARSGYLDWTGSAAVVISAKQLTVTGTTVADKVYDGSTSASITLGTVSGVVSGEAVTVTTAGAFPSAQVGTYDVAVSYTLSGAVAGNYLAPAATSVRASITPKPNLDITLTGYSGVYDGASHGVTLAGTQTGDIVTYSANGVAYTTSPITYRKVGNYTIYVKVARDGFQDWTGSAAVVISAKQLTVTGTGVANKVYDGTTAAAITLGTVSGVVSGEAVTVTTAGAFPSAQVGMYDVPVSYTLSGAAASNYIAPAATSVRASITGSASNTKINVRVVLSDAAPSDYDVTQLPESIETAVVGMKIYAQVWIMNADGSDNGITGGYLDLTYTDAALTVGATTAGTYYTGQSGYANTSIPGLVSTFGGFAAAGQLSYGTDSWVLLGCTEFTAADSGAVTIATNPPTLDGVENEAMNLIRTREYQTLSSEIDFGSASMTLIVTVPLAAPTDISIASGGANRHCVTWSAVENALEYEVAWSADQTNWQTARTGGLSYTVTGLTYGASMSYKVTAIGDGLYYSDSEPSAAASLKVCPIDVDSDGFIGPGDWGWISAAWFSNPSKASWDVRADMDGDGFVGPTDLNYLTTNWFKFSTESDFFYPPAPSAAAGAASAASDAVFDDAFESAWEDEFEFFG